MQIQIQDGGKDRWMHEKDGWVNAFSCITLWLRDYDHHNEETAKVSRKYKSSFLSFLVEGNMRSCSCHSHRLWAAKTASDLALLTSINGFVFTDSPSRFTRSKNKNILLFLFFCALGFPSFQAELKSFSCSNVRIRTGNPSSAGPCLQWWYLWWLSCLLRADLTAAD